MCFLKLRKIHGKHIYWSHFLTVLQISRPETPLKRDSGTGISCGFSAIFRRALFAEHLQLTASADSSVPTNVLSVDHTLVVFSFIFFFYY